MHSDAQVGPPLGTSDHNTGILSGGATVLPSSTLVEVWDSRKSNGQILLSPLSKFSEISSHENAKDMCAIFYVKLEHDIASISISFFCDLIFEAQTVDYFVSEVSYQ